MTQGAPPTPKQPLPIGKIVLIVAGAAILIAVIQQRSSRSPSPTPAASTSSMSNSMAADPPTTPTVHPTQAPEEQLERYPMLDCPDAVPPEQEFPIQVSLTEQQQGAAAKILGGKSTSDGKLILSLPATQRDSWKLQVIVSATGLQFPGGSIGSIDLPRHGDATTALFVAKAGPNLPVDGKVHVLVTYWYQSRYLARIGRDIQVGGIAEAAPSRVTVRMDGGVADTAAELIDQSPEPDLTLFIKKDSITINSPFLQPTTGTLKDATGFAEWLQQNASNFASAGRGSQMAEPAPQPSTERAEGFGELLYEKYAPDVFKSAFWTLVDRRGSRFRTIQVYSDNPQIPWELMKPVRRGSNGTSFLGVDYSIARWHVTDDGIQRDRPPGAETMPTMMVIAPHYSGARTLDAEASEIEGLAHMNGYSAVHGNLSALKALFLNPPQGIVHFAGHGELSSTGGDFAILLEDGELDTTTWRGMVKESTNHPFFFFNACDVGQAKHTGNFVDGWAPAVLDAGASGYIGALFPVNDQVAAKFSIRFYQLLQQQMQTGAADVSATLERTRREIYQSTGSPTALAYVLYGDTNLKFSR